MAGSETGDEVEPRDPGVASTQPTGAVRDRVPKASDVLADRLRARILGDAMQPGDRLPSEADLITSYGFSRGTVREALRLLEADGLIEIKRGPTGGIRVRHPDLTQVGRSLALLLTVAETSTRSFLEFRKLVEPAVAAAAARTATPEQREWLLGIAEEVPGGKVGLGRSVEFHEALGVCSNNEILRAVSAALGQELAWHTPREQLSAADLDHMQRAHRKIARAVVAGDVAGAERATLHHLDRFERILDERGRLDQPVMPRDWWRSHS